MELAIRFQADFVMIKSSDGKIDQRFANTMAFNKKHLLVSIGQTFEEMNAQIPIDTSNEEYALSFEPIYKPNVNCLQNTEIALMYLIAQCLEKAGIRMPFWMGINVHFWMPSYEMIDRKERKKFEYILNNWMLNLLRNLRINESPAGWSWWQISVARISYGVLYIITIIPFFLPFIRTLKMQTSFIGTGLIAIASFVGTVMLMSLVWMLWVILMRYFLPRDLLEQVLLFQIKHNNSKSFGIFERFTQWLIHNFLREDYAEN